MIVLKDRAIKLRADVGGVSQEQVIVMKQSAFCIAQNHSARMHRAGNKVAPASAGAARSLRAARSNNVEFDRSPPIPLIYLSRSPLI